MRYTPIGYCTPGANTVIQNNIIFPSALVPYRAYKRLPRPNTDE